MLRAAIASKKPNLVIFEKIYVNHIHHLTTTTRINIFKWPQKVLPALKKQYIQIPELQNLAIPGLWEKYVFIRSKTTFVWPKMGSEVSEFLKELCIDFRSNFWAQKSVDRVGKTGLIQEILVHLKLVFWAKTQSLLWRGKSISGWNLIKNLYCELEKYFWLKLCPIFSPELLPSLRQPLDQGVSRRREEAVPHILFNAQIEQENLRRS